MDENMDDLDEFDLHQVFAGQEDVLRAELRSGKEARHSGVQGDATEDQWIALLRKRLPQRYEVTKAIVVDSTGHRSHQIDAVIHDRHFSPLWWEQGDHRYVPAESVYAVFEVKPEINREYVLYASRKIASVRRLHRTATSFGWAMGTMPPRPLPPILGGLLAGDSGWSPGLGDPFRSALQEAAPNGILDLGCVLGHGSFEIPDGKSATDVVVSASGVALVSFLLTLLHRLQGLGSAPAIDYSEYARWISGAESGTTE
jgi:hypothetical protein